MIENYYDGLLHLPHYIIEEAYFKVRSDIWKGGWGKGGVTISFPVKREVGA